MAPEGNLNRYSALDRLLHAVAFGGLAAQRAVSDVEDQLHSRALSSISIRRPVFVAGLPRAGTTVLLRQLNAAPQLAAHTYRNMPFVLVPLLWNDISQGFRLPAAPSERAHGDGLQVGFDSVEAFEEVIWKSCYPRKYGAASISLWTDADRNRTFSAFYRSHMKKLILLHQATGATRYLSKNNANIARIPLLRSMFPDADIVVPFRDPVQQASSLLMSHKRFLDLQASDRFVLKYMDSLGHYEFGAGLRPLQFQGFEKLKSLDPLSLAYWIEYWDLAYRGLCDMCDGAVRFLDYDTLCGKPADTLKQLFVLLGLPAEVTANGDQLRAPTAYPGSTLPAAHAARETHERLKSLSAAALLC